MRPYVETMANIAECYCSVHPNAGLPNEFGEYDLAAAEMAIEIKDWAQQGFLNIVGGCCGTTPEHIRAISQAVEGLRPRQPKPISHQFNLAGLEAFTLEYLLGIGLMFISRQKINQGHKHSVRKKVRAMSKNS